MILVSIVTNHGMKRFAGTREFVCPYTDGDLVIVQDYARAKQPHCCPQILAEVWLMLMDENGLEAPTSNREARKLYLFLRRESLQLIN